MPRRTRRERRSAIWASFAGRIRRVIADECVSLRLPVPHLVIEPGRAIVNRAMVTLYRVLGVKHGAAGRALVAVDGEMSDNRSA